MQREGIKLRPGLASGLFRYAPLHNNLMRLWRTTKDEKELWGRPIFRGFGMTSILTQI
jgi:hypothetical protein